MEKLRIIFAGSGEFGLPSLRALRQAGLAIVRVVSQPDRPAGRGKRLTPTPVAQYALDNAMDLLRTDDINREALPDADAMVVIAFGQKLSEELVRRPRLGSLNLHASLLPKYRGAAPINWAMLKGEQETGNSVIRLAQRMDAGAVLGQSRLAIGATETAGELHDRLAEDGATLVLRVLEELAAGTARETPQDEAQATLAPKLKRETARIDWTAPAGRAAMFIRALYPWPGCRVELRDAAGRALDRLTLVRARPAGAASGSPGRIGADGSIAAGDGAVEMIDVQPEGKRPMPLAAYRNGHPWPEGGALEALG